MMPSLKAIGMTLIISICLMQVISFQFNRISSKSHSVYISQKHHQPSSPSSGSQFQLSSSTQSDEEKVYIIDEDDANENSRKVSSASSLEMEHIEQLKYKRSMTAKPKKETPKRPTSRQLSGYIYHDTEGEYDVPILNQSMWFQVQVKKNSEFKLRDYFIDLSKLNKWRGLIVDAYVPERFYPKFKGKELVAAPKPLTAGSLYLKVKMNPDVADFIESVEDVSRLVKTVGKGIVIPLDLQQGEDLETARRTTNRELDESLRLMRKDGYVRVVSGIHQGKYGILNKANSGRFEVLLRSEYKDEPVMLEPEEVEHLEDPPEKKWTDMTAKDAVEALLIKDPTNPILKSLRKSGKLKEILYADGEVDDGRYDPYEDKFKRKDRKQQDSPMQGREGGASLRSIAVTGSAASGKSGTSAAREVSSFWDISDLNLQVSDSDNSRTNDSSNNVNVKRQSGNQVNAVAPITKSWNKKSDANPVSSSSSFTESSSNSFKGKNNRFNNNKDDTDIYGGIPRSSPRLATQSSQQAVTDDDESMDEWLAELLGDTTPSATSSGATSVGSGSGDVSSSATKSNKNGKEMMASSVVNEDEDYESLIQSLLDDLDDKSAAAGGTKGSYSKTSSTTGKSSIDKVKSGSSTTGSFGTSDSSQDVDDWLAELTASDNNSESNKKPTKAPSRPAIKSVTSSTTDRLDSERVLEELLRELDMNDNDNNNSLFGTTSSSSSSSSNINKSVQPVVAAPAPATVVQIAGKRVWVPKNEAPSYNSNSKKSSSSSSSDNFNNMDFNYKSKNKNKYNSNNNDNNNDDGTFDDDDDDVGNILRTAHAESKQDYDDQKQLLNENNNNNRFSSNQPWEEPSMDQYPDFESYIAAVIKFEADSSSAKEQQKGQKQKIKESKSVTSTNTMTAVSAPVAKSTSSHSKGKASSSTVAGSDSSGTKGNNYDDMMDDNNSIIFDRNDSNDNSDISHLSVSDMNDMLDEFYSSESESSSSSSSSFDSIKTDPMSAASITDVHKATESSKMKSPSAKSATPAAVSKRKQKQQGEEEQQVAVTSSSSAAVVIETKPPASLPPATATASSNQSTQHTESALSGMTVIALKELCRESGKPVSGTKAQLVNRLLSSGTG